MKTQRAVLPNVVELATEYRQVSAPTSTPMLNAAVAATQTPILNAIVDEQTELCVGQFSPVKIVCTGCGGKNRKDPCYPKVVPA